MTFGRWLLVHSFSIFLVSVFVLGYIYRDELQLEQAYQQLLAKPLKPVHVEQPEAEPESESVSEEIKATEHEVTPAIPETAAKEQPQGGEVAPDADTAIDYIESTPTISRTIIDLNAQLLKARKAYWDKDYPSAIQYYQQLIQDDETNPDYRGELGNIYYSLNDYDNAAMHYYQAALILISQNKPDQARLLLSPISAMNRDLGDQLKHRLSQP